MMLKNQLCITGINYIVKYIYMKTRNLNEKKIKILLFYCIFYKINAALVGISTSFKNI